jgi:hypothetical protein
LDRANLPKIDWIYQRVLSALAGFEPALRLIDDIDAPLAPHDAIIAMARAQRFQRIADFHGTFS